MRAALPADRFRLREVDQIRVKGKQQPVLVFERRALVSEDGRAQTPELAALQELAAEFAAARAPMLGCKEQNLSKEPGRGAHLAQRAEEG